MNCCQGTQKLLTTARLQKQVDHKDMRLSTSDSLPKTWTKREITQHGRWGKNTTSLMFRVTLENMAQVHGGMHFLALDLTSVTLAHH